MIIYSTNDTDFIYGDFDSLLDAMEDNNALHAGAVYFEADIRPMTSADIIANSESLLERWGELLYEEVEETADNPFTGVPAAAKQELAELISGWMDKHVDLSSWVVFVGKSRECVLTAADIADHAGETMSEQTDQNIEQPEELARLRSFALDVMETWPRGDLEGGELQDLAVKHGLLVPETRYAPCGEECFCAEDVFVEDFEDGVICYRRAALLVADEVSEP